MGTKTTITVADVAHDGLPDGATGVRWHDTGWTECVDHLRDFSWISAAGPDDATGTVLFGDVDCDACAER